MSHCMMEDAGWIAADPCCLAENGDTHESEPVHDECVECVFESSAILSIKSDIFVPALDLDSSGDQINLTPAQPCSQNRTVGIHPFVETNRALQQLVLSRICPIRGPSFRF